MITLKQSGQRPYFSKWIGTKPLFSQYEGEAKKYNYAMQAEQDLLKLWDQGYRVSVKAVEGMVV
jgi:hypothetical protein